MNNYLLANRKMLGLIYSNYLTYIKSNWLRIYFCTNLVPFTFPLSKCRSQYNDRMGRGYFIVEWFIGFAEFVPHSFVQYFLLVDFISRKLYKTLPDWLLTYVIFKALILIDLFICIALNLMFSLLDFRKYLIWILIIFFYCNLEN